MLSLFPRTYVMISSYLVEESLSSSSRTPSTESASNSNAVAPSSSSQVHPSAVISPTVPSRPGWQQDGKRVFPTSASTPQAQTTPITTTTASAIPHQLQKESSLSAISSPPQSPLLKKSSVPFYLPWIFGIGMFYGRCIYTRSTEGRYLGENLIVRRFIGWKRWVFIELRGDFWAI
ncbi:unnamed protein product [Anisakis simplex]|uniref:Uncharacterized protein n=1 Tax=Anisakis simplex TaxID=6269 RepID=A0A0M3J212_ANISI|nr:unnamed protein product [Anisakis simplex]